MRQITEQFTDHLHTQQVERNMMGEFDRQDRGKKRKALY